ncbi:MAG: DUF4876 domain-containing protein [Ignavibacteria bacterium]|jgi:hypothetical protein
MKRTFYITYALLVFVFFSCEKVVDIEEKPEVEEGSVNFVLQIVDSTGTLNAVYGRDYVDDASVFIESNLQNDQYTFQSDSKGIVNVGKVVSGEYLIVVKRDVTPEEMEKATGEKLFQKKLVNSGTGTIELRADMSDTVKVMLNKISTESTLVISEIYACGPPEAGLYFHDKYVEIYNQSDKVIYLDGMLIALAYYAAYTGENYANDPDYIHSENIWKFPGKGTDYPIEPGQFVVCAEDGMDHRINAPNSVDLSNVGFEFYKSDAPDVDYKDVPNMQRVYQNYGYDWLIGGETDAIVIADFDPDSLIWNGAHYIIPTSAVLDGVEYLYDPTDLSDKSLCSGIDAGATGGILFYTGKSMERKLVTDEKEEVKLKDDNNSSLDFNINSQPTPQYHNELN